MSETAEVLARGYGMIYDRLATEYASREPMHTPIILIRLTRFIPHLEGPLVLDPGCGTGETVTALSEAGLLAVGCDVSAEMVLRASRRSPGVIVQGDFMHALAGPFHGILETALVHLYPRAEEARIFGRFRDLLHPGGLLSVSTTLNDASTEDWEPKHDYLTPAHRYRRRFSEGELAAAFVTHGFRVTGTYTIPDVIGKTWTIVTGKKEN